MAIVAVAAGAGAANASAETINEDFPFRGPVPSSCTGETIAMEGTAHLKTTDNSSSDGIKSQIEMNLTGVKGIGMLTGARYVMNSQSSEMAHAELDPDGNAQMTTEQTFILTRQGETGALLTGDELLTGDDFRFHVILHLTVTKGVPTAVKTDLRERDPCR